MADELKQTSPMTAKSILSATLRFATILIVAVMIVYFISHFPFGRVEYVYQGY